MYKHDLYDFYVIGGPDGFYVGQARHTTRLGRTGGWSRRVAEHRSGKYGTKSAYALLTAGAEAHLLGTIACDKALANLIEALAWDARKADGWRPVHLRPRVDAPWGASASEAGVAGARARWARSAEAEGATRKAFSEKVRARWASYSAEQRHQIGLNMANAKKRIPKDRLSEIGKEARKHVRPSRANLHGLRQGPHVRWHVARGLVAPSCAFCTAGEH